MGVAPNAKVVRFGVFEVDLQAGELHRAGLRVKLQEQPFQVLAMLLERRGEVVTREELRQRLWSGDTFVDFDHSLSTAVKKLRQALRDEADTPRYIETLPKRGYRFIAPVDTLRSPALEQSERVSPAAAPMRTSRRRRWAFLLVGILAVTALSASFAWLITHRPLSARPELKERRLTAVTSEDALTQGAISPDGKYLAYGDQRGMHLKLIRTGETANIPQPLGPPSVSSWWPNAWFPDGTKFITAEQQVGQNNAWVVSVLGGPPRKLRDDADPWSVSPDGTLIAYGAGEGFIRSREVWVMGPQGEEPRRLVAGSEDDGFFWTAWSPDGQRIAYERFHRDPDRTECSIESRDLKGGQPTLLLSDPGLCDSAQFLWLPGGRFIYATLDPEVRGSSELGLGAKNVWEIAVDAITGQPISKPRRITNWTEVGQLALSATSNGKQLAVSKTIFQSAVYVGELGRHLKNVHRLTRNENENFPGQWTPDSKAVLLWSDRNGSWDIFRQALDQPEAQPVVIDSNHKVTPVLSPDGLWILYLSIPGGEVHADTPLRILRVPTSGGAPQLVLAGRGIEDIVCARSPATNCVFSERTPDNKQIVLSALDPMRGRRQELTKIGQTTSWDLSPDGSRLAFGHHYSREFHIQTLPLSGAKSADFNLKNWVSRGGLYWAADGNSLFVPASGIAAAAAPVLLRVDLQGRAQIVWQQDEHTGFFSGSHGWMPSPNGRYMALCGFTNESNVWLVENF